MTAELGLLLAIVFLAFAVQASLGFGSALVAVSLGSLVAGVDEVLPAFMPVNLALSAYLAVRYRHRIVWPLLGRRVLPGMLLGLPLGLGAFGMLPAPLLRRTLGAFVIVLSGLELFRLRQADAAANARPLGRGLAFGLLVLGGIAHGAFATGGPIAVYVAGRELGDEKQAFRATLSALWLILNIVMMVGYAWLGRLGFASARVTAMLVPPLLLGLVVGEALHARLPLQAFKKIVFVFVGAAGVVLLAAGR